MDWWNLLYLVIGGVLTALGGFATQVYLAKVHKDNYEREKRDKDEAILIKEKKEFYVEVVSTMTMACAEQKLSDDTSIKLNNLRAKFLLYTNQEWFDIYWEILAKILENKKPENFDIKELEKFYADLKNELFNK
jgi:hypothetical protein